MQISEIIKNIYGKSFEESFRILLESYYKDDRLHIRPLSKTKKDFLKELGII